MSDDIAHNTIMTKMKYNSELVKDKLLEYPYGQAVLMTHLKKFALSHLQNLEFFKTC